MTDDTWPNVCVLCAARDRQTRLKFGHCCAACADRICSDLSAIVTLAGMAAASLIPGQGSTGGTSIAYGSRPPINVDAVDPALAHVPGYTVPLLVILEEWERMIREERGMARYGPASAARIAVSPTTGNPVTDPTHAALTGVVAFLRAQVEWAASEPGFPLEDFSGEVHACVRALRRWDTEREDVGTMVRCPTLTDAVGDGGLAKPCGYRLYYDDVHEDVTCRRCGTTRSAMTLAAVAMSDGREVWLDPEAAASWLGVSEVTLRRMARRGDIQRSHGRYLIQHTALTNAPVTVTMC